ncbi:MAG: OsmC family protein [Candidatus Bathyarchaeia archaeon]
MSQLELAAKARRLDGTRTGIRIREFPEIVVDTMPRFGGTDAGPCPVELMLASLASCIVETAVYLAKKARVRLGDVTAETRATVLREGAGYTLRDVETLLRVQVSPRSLERAKDCLELLDKSCILTGSLMKCPPVKVSIEAARAKTGSRETEMI